MYKKRSKIMTLTSIVSKDRPTPPPVAKTDGYNDVPEYLKNLGKLSGSKPDLLALIWDELLGHKEEIKDVAGDLTENGALAQARKHGLGGLLTYIA